MATGRQPKRKRLTPQEKKRLSYARDRREWFGQNDKASRRLVPLRKAQAARKVRRKDKASLKQGDVGQIAVARPKPVWKKATSHSLADDLAAKRAARIRREGRRKRSHAEWIDWYRRFHGEAVAQRMAKLLRAREGKC